MREVVGSNIRQHRERLSWTQQQLAEAAAVNVRTIQRAEEGRGISRETLLAVAGALNVSVEDLQTDPAARQLEALKAQIVAVPLAIVKTSADLRPAFDADAMHFDCLPPDDAVHDAASELKQSLRALLDIAPNLEPIEEREYAKSLFDQIQRLETHGVVVSLGLRNHYLVDTDGERPLPCRTLFVVIAPADEPKMVAIVPRNGPAGIR